MAEFSADKTEGSSHLTVQFTDLSTGKPTFWFWYFGDETYSQEQNPVHTYSDVGQFRFKLFIKNEKTSSTMEKQDHITCR
jgi:PKD repeat protein